MNKKAVTIAAAMIPFVATLVGFTGFTFSWFVLQSKNTSVKVGVSAASLAVDNLELTCYKAFFPDFEGEYVTPGAFINSDGTPKVYSSTDTPKPDRGFEMNLLDPTYITISDDIGFYDLYTALVYKISFDVTYSSKIDMDISIKRNVTNSERVSGQLYVSDYVHYYALSDAESKTITEDSTEILESFDGGVDHVTLKYVPKNGVEVKVNGSTMDPSNYTLTSNRIDFASTVQAGTDIISVGYESYDYILDEAKNVSLNLATETYTTTGDGTTTTFTLPKTPVKVNSVMIGETVSRGHTISGDEITFLSAPANNETITISYTYSQNQADAKIKTFPSSSVENLSLFGNTRSPLVNADPAEETVGSFETYVVVDYDPALCGYNDSTGFFLTSNLGKDYTLFDDYEFVLEVAQI